MQKRFELYFIVIPTLLSLIFVTISCSKEKTMSTTPTPNTVPAMQANNKSMLALGDSYTIGQSVPETERFAAQTAQILKANNINITPQYIATTGWTTINLKSAIDREKPAANFDIVTLLIGVNDQYQRLDTNGYKIRFEELLNTAIKHAAGEKKRVFVLSIPDYSVTPFAAMTDRERISEEINAFNVINKRITLQYNITYIDITPSTRQALTDPSLVAGDGLHPSGKEYKKWADMLAPLVESALK